MLFSLKKKKKEKHLKVEKEVVVGRKGKNMASDQLANYLPE